MCSRSIRPDKKSSLSQGATSKLSRAVHISQIQFQTILNNIPDQAWLKDASGRYLAVNNTYVTACGLSEDKILGHTAADVWPAEVAAQYMRTDQRVLSSGRQWLFEEQRMRRVGKMATFETIKAPVRDYDGVIIGTTGISRDVTRYKAIQTQLIKQRERSNKLWIHLQSVQDGERARISRELHDDLSQNLSALRLGLDWLETSLPLEQPVLLDKIQRLREITDSTMQQMRRIALELRPAVLIDLGLRAAIQHVVVTTIECGSHAVNVQLEFGVDESAFDQDTKFTFFRVFQEALTNVRRHADAKTVLVRIYETRKDLLLEVDDDGRGMNLAEAAELRSGLGILGMEERARLLGGRLNLLSKAGEGTHLTLRIPKRRFSRRAN
ncbi:MAG: PAS domain-containing protein [Proteobacteria bacterium]|nr:PAS domain-containing protein [Pseudomonadota bacterium]